MSLNNPFSYVDPSGLYCAYLNDQGDQVEEIDDDGNKDSCGDNGGYWISGSYGGGSQVNIDVDSGTVTGLGYDSSGNAEVSRAGAMGSNAWGAWTQTYGTGVGLGLFSGNSGANGWGWNFSKAFFGNFFSLNFYKSEFSNNGCLSTFASASLDALNPASPSLAGAGGAGAMTVSAATRYNAAQAYAASRTNVLGGQGLIFPQKSIPYNNILKGSAVTNLAEGVGGYVDGAMAQGLLTEYEEAMTGVCH